MLERLDRVVVAERPFPHVVLEGALDDDLCRTLVRELPPLAALTRGSRPGSNARFTLNSGQVLSDRRISATWKQVIREGLAQTLLDRVTHLFGPHIRRTFPDFVARFGAPEALRAVPRLSRRPAASSVGVDAQIAVNTPVLTPGTTVRGPHLDVPDKLFVGLLYLRPDTDRSEGGDLELYDTLTDRPILGPGRTLPPASARVARTVPYRSNTLVLFLNTPQAFHGVSPRSVTEYPRYFLNLVGEVGAPLFHVPTALGPSGRAAWPDWPGRIWNLVRSRWG